MSNTHRINLFLLGCQSSKENRKEQPLKVINQIDFSHVKISDNFGLPDSASTSQRLYLFASIK